MLSNSKILRFDQAALQTQFPECHSLGDLIQKFEERSWSEGEVICEVRVNGMFLTEQDESNFASSKISEIKEIQFSLKRPDDLSWESIRSAIQLIPKVSAESVRVAELIREGQIQRAQEILIRVFDCCHWLSNALNLLKKTNSQQMLDTAPGENWGTLEREFGKVVKEMLVAFQRRDYLLLGDLLEYELSRVLDNWLELLKRAYRIERNE